ncbi:MAG TPA: DUF664 domain-containing protein, partial [Streptosporangiaceae bacterium]|nr:DUF664 domain-containing protein [Streptosporangiaceae bacterium]
LDGFLDWHRATLLWKCAGLTGEQLALASVPPSNLSLLGIVRPRRPATAAHRRGDRFLTRARDLT